MEACFHHGIKKKFSLKIVCNKVRIAGYKLAVVTLFLTILISFHIIVRNSEFFSYNLQLRESIS